MLIISSCKQQPVLPKSGLHITACLKGQLALGQELDPSSDDLVLPAEPDDFTVLGLVRPGWSEAGEISLSEGPGGQLLVR